MTFRLMAGFAFIFALGTFISSAIDGGGGLVITSLTANLAKNGTTATVASTTGFLSAGYVVIEGEELYYSGKTPTTLTLAANHNSHPSGAKVMSEAAGALNSLIGFDVGATNTTIGPLRTAWTTGTAFAKAIPKMLLWDYSYLENEVGKFLKLVFLFPISLGFSVMLALTLRDLMRGALVP